MITSKYKGYNIFFDGTEYRYTDTGEPTIGNNRPCGNCCKESTKEGHDECMGTLKGIMNACCGHGEEEEAYIQFLDGFVIYGKDAAEIQIILKKYK